MDWEKMLRAYMKTVMDYEGHTYLPVPSDFGLSDAEQDELHSIAYESDQLSKYRKLK